VIELQLIGYTEDGEHLVLDLDVDGAGRYAVRVDPDLLATVAQLRDVRVRRGLVVDHREVLPAPPLEREPGSAFLPSPAVASPNGRGADREAVERAALLPQAGSSPPVGEPTEEVGGSGAATSKLSPAEIQAQLRAGRSVRVVAAEAGTDLASIERWLPPILAERERVLAEARARRLDAPRARPLGEVVDEALAKRGVPPERRRWSATRRADGRWRVSVRFEDRGRPRTATWLMDPAGDRLAAASPLAGELAGPGRRTPRHR
jgi:hypothetical protein